MPHLDGTAFAHPGVERIAMQSLRVVVPVSFAFLCAGAASAQQPNAGSRGAPVPTRPAQTVEVQPSSAEPASTHPARTSTTSTRMHETRSAAAGSTSAPSASDDESSRPSSQQTVTASGDQDQSAWRSRDWGWLGLLGLFGLLGLLRKGRYRREMYPYTPSAGDVPPHGAGVHESSADIGRRRQMS